MGLRSLSFIFFYAFQFIFLDFAFADNNCIGYLNAEIILFEHTNEIVFSDVEVFRRNNDVSIQQNGKLKFVKWFELTFEFSPDINKAEASSLVGLTKNGQIYHLVKFNRRTIARLLSGEQTFNHFEVSNKGRVIAWNNKNVSYIYSSELWRESPKKDILKRWFKLWGITTSAVVTAKLIFFADIYFPVEMLGYEFGLPLFEVFIGTTVGLSSGLAMLSRYAHLNTYPNGFIKWDENLSRKSWTSELEDFRPPTESELMPKLSSEYTEDIL